MGKNLASFDTSEFPFSYINVDGERSILTPGMNLFTVGTRRDSAKWPKRDKRKDPEKYDLINFDFLSPYIVQKVISALDILSALYEKASKKQETVFYKGIRIKRLMLKSTRKYYEMALAIFIGDQLIKKLETMDKVTSLESLRSGFAVSGTAVSDSWIDMAGMIAPNGVVQDLVGELKSGSIDNLEAVSTGLKKVHESYEDYVWDWTVELLSGRYGLDIQRVDKEQLIERISKWETESIKLDKMILNDSNKEFDDSSKLGFGIDGDKSVVDKDFEAVRGVREENSFIAGVEEEIQQIQAKAAELKDQIEKME